MDNRPNFSDINSYEEFKKYYWFRDELSKICKLLDIDHTGTKQELNRNIDEYFKGFSTKKRKLGRSKKLIEEITLDSPLLACDFSFNAKYRDIFSKQTGIVNFKFNADMATAWRKVKREQDNSFTIQDMLNIYYHQSDYAKYDNTSCEWNKFLKDFCADSRNVRFKNKLKSASIIWNIVRDSSLPKVYSYDLIQQYEYLLYEYE